MVTTTKTPNEVFMADGNADPKGSEIVTLMDEYGVAIDASILSPVAASGSNVTVAATDGGKTFEQSAASTITFPELSTVAAGFMFHVVADGGDVALNPFGSEQVNGAATLTLQDTEAARVVSTGTAWRAVVTAGLGTLGTAAAADTGTGTGDVVVLEDVDGSPGLPAVDGSQLLNVIEARREDVTISSDAQVTSIWPDGADYVDIELIQVLPETDGAGIYLDFSVDSGVSWEGGASDYEWYQLGLRSGNGDRQDAFSTGDTKIDLTVISGDGVGTAAGERGVTGTLRLHRPGASGDKAVSGDLFWINSDGGRVSIHLQGFYTGSDEINGVRLVASAGDLATGTLRRISYY